MPKLNRIGFMASVVLAIAILGFSGCATTGVETQKDAFAPVSYTHLRAHET